MEEAATEPLAGNVYVGTSGFVFDDWYGTVYPARLKPRETLAYYLNEFHFTALELNVTFYRMPTSDFLGKFVARTPPAFPLAVKVHRDITHMPAPHPSREAATLFMDAIAPLREAGKLAALLLQFPYSFHRTAAHCDYVKECRDAFPDVPLAVEFRHDSWHTNDIPPMLRDSGMSLCAVDEPRIQKLMPFSTRVTSPLGYVRLHGRNRAWFTAGEKERYNYDYSSRELDDIVSRIRSIAAQTQKVLVFFNNCYMGRAVKNAYAVRERMAQAG